jgi:GAF domain-containing protein
MLEVGGRSEAERTLHRLAQRARIGLALTLAGLGALSRELGGLPDQAIAAMLLVAIAFGLAAVVHEMPTSPSHESAAVLAGVIGDLAAATLAVMVLYEPVPLAPAVFLWPLLTAGFVATPLALLAVASFETVIVAALTLAVEPSSRGLIHAAGWGFLYTFGAFLHIELSRQFRQAHRASEAAAEHGAHLAYSSSPGEVADLVFAFLDRLLGTAGRAALLYDRRGEGEFIAVATRGMPPDARAQIRFRPQPRGIAAALLHGQGVWLDREDLADLMTLDGQFDGVRRVFVLPLRHEARIAGFALLAATRERNLSDEAREGIARVAARAGAALHRVRSIQLIEQQRAAMSLLLDARKAGDDVGAIAVWAARAALDVVGAHAAAVVARNGVGDYDTLAAEPAESLDAEDAVEMLAEAFARHVPIVVADASREERFPLGQSLAKGSCVAVPVHSEAAALLAYREDAVAFSSADVELLIMLADQTSLLLARAQAPRERRALGRVRNVGERRAPRTGRARS